MSGLDLVLARPAARRLEPASWRRWVALPVVLTGTFVIVLDFFIVNVALPSMQRDLHASSGSIEWIVAGYALTSAVFLIAWPCSRLRPRRVAPRPLRRSWSWPVCSRVSPPR